MKYIDIKDCTLFLIDGTGTNYIAIRVGEGNFTYSRKRTVEPKKVRGSLHSSRVGEEEPVEINFQFVWDSIDSSGDEPPTIEEIIDGMAPGWISASSDPNAPFAINIQIVRSYTCRQPNGVAVTDGEIYNFSEFNCQELSHNLRDSMVDAKGYSNRVKPHVLRNT